MIASILKCREQDCVIHFLKGLNEKFTHSKSQIMMMNPLPYIGKTFFIVIQQEREMNSSISAMTLIIINNEDIVAFQVHNYNGKPSYSKGKT